MKLEWGSRLDDSVVNVLALMVVLCLCRMSLFVGVTYWYIQGDMEHHICYLLSSGSVVK